MTRTRTLLASALGIAGICLSPAARAQTPPPPPAGAAMAAPPTDAAPPPSTPIASVTAPMVAAKSADDMTGSFGFGVGVIGSTQIVGTQGDVAVKYWTKDDLALVPALNFNLTKSTGTDTTWLLNPQLVVLFVPFKSTSTRLLVGGGLGFQVGKLVPGAPTEFGVNVPIEAGVEHFFARWFSMGIAAETNLFSYTHVTGASTMELSINSASLLGSLFFYTD